MYSGKRHTSCSPALRIASSTSSSTFMVRASAKAPMTGLSSWYRMSRLQKARTAKAGNSITAISKPSLGEKAFETEPPIVLFPLDPKKRHLQWATWWVFGSSETGGLSEDPKKRHQKLRKPAKLRLCRSQALLPLAWCFQDAGKSKVQEVPCLRTLRIRLRVRPKFPPLRRA